MRVRQRADTDNDGKFIRAEAWLDKAGYIAGETIHFNAKIENSRDESVRNSYIQLIQVNSAPQINYTISSLMSRLLAKSILYWPIIRIASTK